MENTPRKEKEKEYPEIWIAAFMSSCKRGEVMKKADISKTQYYRLRNDQEFQAIVRARRDDIVREAVMKMESYLNENVEELQKIIRDPNTKQQTKVSALSLYMNQLGQWRGMTDFIDRLQALEDAQALYKTF